ncbi:unnamed protein product, partial [Brassica oleracea]
MKEDEENEEEESRSKSGTILGHGTGQPRSVKRSYCTTETASDRDYPQSHSAKSSRTEKKPSQMSLTMSNGTCHIAMVAH